jgi:hypothetical protein
METADQFVRRKKELEIGRVQRARVPAASVTVHDVKPGMKVVKVLFLKRSWRVGTAPYPLGITSTVKQEM